jgi:hypothetical protein
MPSPNYFTTLLFLLEFSELRLQRKSFFEAFTE